MVDSSRDYPKKGNGEVATFPEKHVALVGKGSTQETVGYSGLPMARTVGGTPEDRMRNIYAKDASRYKDRPTVEDITPPSDPMGPSIDSSNPSIVPV